MLCLSENEIRDIAALSGLSNLTELYLDHNKIKDFSPIVNLPLWKNPDD
ncbi:MAG: leucine-rich repeat domain-containing protein [Candidatus Limivicinus sp.]|jgi:Leucine-rich repeat (LRR) protein